eukprot:TRINITY_DN28508_c0_g1_i1.p1 TRINITY_DN28508_c0_g1~~TRINITY_DN28508_c0_g1_i1.p1  ORF type:complete len:451 (+),score=144.42 TRINITY_DN28508_c0_g1_i1:200-1552(+)
MVRPDPKLEQAKKEEADRLAEEQAKTDEDRLAAFSQQLGIGPLEADEFGWVAEVGLQSPLPPRWTSHTDPGSQWIYYVDHDRQVSSWENPLVPYLRRVVEIGRAYLKNPTATFFEDQKALLWHEHKHDLDCWAGPFSDKEGRQYYVNAAAGLSSWQDPRIDAQYIFELESGLLLSLEEVLPQAPEQENEPPADNAQEWRTAGGAEVLTLDGSRPDTSASRVGTARSKASLQKKAASSAVITGVAQKTAQREHRTTLETMGAAADRLHDLRQDDVEAQRLQLEKERERRRQRRAQAGPPPPPPMPPAPPLGGAALTPEKAAAAIGPPPPEKEAPPTWTGGRGVGPPPTLPSPTNGKKPALAAELQQRMKRNGDDKEGGAAASEAAAFTELSLLQAPPPSSPPPSVEQPVLSSDAPDGVAVPTAEDEEIQLDDLPISRHFKQEDDAAKSAVS